MKGKTRNKGQGGNETTACSSPLCGHCGVPLQVSAELKWEDNGVISSRTSKRTRWVFYESENLDPLFHNIETLIGLPIEHIVIASRCRETRKYMERVFPEEYRVKARRMLSGEAISEEDRKALLEMARTGSLIAYNLAGIYGYGQVELGPLWEEGDEHPWRLSITTAPWSLPLQAAECLGSCEAFEGRDMWVLHPQVGKDTYHMIYTEEGRPIELGERKRKTSYELKPGDIAFERCPECGTPLEIARYRWDLERGLIIDPDTGRRMAIFGCFALDAVFDDLIEELGEAVSETIIAAQKLYIKTAWGEDSWKRDLEGFRKLDAIRGLGYFADITGDRHHVSVRVQNACLPLLVVGMAQAMVEMVYRVDESALEWKMHSDGDLTINITIA